MCKFDVHFWQGRGIIRNATHFYQEKRFLVTSNIELANVISLNGKLLIFWVENSNLMQMLLVFLRDFCSPSNSALWVIKKKSLAVWVKVYKP